MEKMRTLICVVAILCLNACLRSPAYKIVLEGREMAKRNNFEGAIRAYEDAIRLEPGNIEAYYSRGFAKYEVKDYEGAIEDLTYLEDFKGKIAKDNFKYIFNTRGNANYFLGNNEAALKDHNAAISVDPKFTAAYGNRGNVKMLLGDTPGAIADYSFAISIKPGDFAAYNNRGVAKSDLKDYLGAMTGINKAIRYNKDYEDAYNNRGLVKLRIKDYEGAIRDLDKAIALADNFTFAYNNRGDAKHQLNETAGACEDWAKAIELGSEEAKVSWEKYCKR
jgi:tetratricopeptide (TPR) repeat protein